jgi:MFS family permease
VSAALSTPERGPAANWTAALLVVTGNFIQSVSVGINAVVLPTSLQAYGASPGLIGFLLAVEFVSVFAVSFGLPQLLRFASLYTWAIASTLLRLPAIALLAYTTEFHWWFLLILLHGFGNILFGTLLQTWINSIPFSRARGLSMAMFGVSISLGLACGPLVLQVLDPLVPLIVPIVESTDRWLREATGLAPDAAIAPGTRIQLFASAILSTIAVLPIMLGRLFAPRFERTESASLVRAVRLAPAIMFAVAVCGVSILGLQSFITVYGMSNGLGLSEASLLLTAFMLGSILLEMPVAWLSDFFDRRYVMIALVLLSLIAAVYLPIAIYDPWSARVLLFLWGGVIGGLYSICLAVTAERFTGPDLVAANAAFSIMDASGGMVGILAIGLAMQLLGVDGLPYVIMFASVAYFSFALTRYQVR